MHGIYNELDIVILMTILKYEGFNHQELIFYMI